MRVSSYNIYVELENNPNYNILVQGYTGALDIITKDIALILKKTKGDSILEDIDKETFELLFERGYITKKSKEEERNHLKELSKYVYENKKIRQPKQNSFLFAVTENCNFRCPYCYENGVSDYGNKWKQGKHSA